MEAAEQQGGAQQCPVCLDDTVVNPLFPFDCGHPICRSCDSQLFSRADDRCPMCRQPRTQDSVDSNVRNLVPELAQRRAVMLAQRQSEAGSRPGVIFFLAQGMLEVDATDFVVAAHAEPREDTLQQLTPDSLHAALSSSQVADAVGALVNASNVPISEFDISVAALRSQRGRSTRFSQRT